MSYTKEKHKRIVSKTTWFVLLVLCCLILSACAQELTYFQIKEWEGELTPKPLIIALHDKDWRVRQEAAANLGKIGDPIAVEPLIGVLKDDDWRVQLEAAKALGKLKDSRAIKPLETLVEKNFNTRVREAVKKALVRIKKAN